MEHDQQGSRMVVSVRRRHAHRDRPVAANGDVDLRRGRGLRRCRNARGDGATRGTGLPESGAGAPEHATTRTADNAETASAFMGNRIRLQFLLDGSVRLYLRGINVASLASLGRRPRNAGTVDLVPVVPGATIHPAPPNGHVSP